MCKSANSSQSESVHHSASWNMPSWSQSLHSAPLHYIDKQARHLSLHRSTKHLPFQGYFRFPHDGASGRCPQQRPNPPEITHLRPNPTGPLPLKKVPRTMVRRNANPRRRQHARSQPIYLGRPPTQNQPLKRATHLQKRRHDLRQIRNKRPSLRQTNGLPALSSRTLRAPILDQRHHGPGDSKL